jgi:hypothetical protein
MAKRKWSLPFFICCAEAGAAGATKAKASARAMAAAAFSNLRNMRDNGHYLIGQNNAAAKDCERLRFSLLAKRGMEQEMWMLALIQPISARSQPRN